MDASSVKEVKDLDVWLKERNLNGHWNHEDREHEEFKPTIWKWDDIHTGLMKATELVPMDQTGRRTVQMRIPTLRGRMSNTIHMSVQCVMPGEVGALSVGGHRGDYPGAP